MTCGKRNNFSLYIHFPWCIKKCPYCDFNSHTALQTIPYDEYIQALIDDYMNAIPLVEDRTLTSIFLGGGTPSLFAPKYIEKILKKISTITPIDNIEITLEANPGSIDLNHIRGYRDAGINRLSLGIQSFNDRSLKEIGRIHTANDAYLALDTACNIFKRINVDLMFGLPEQTLEMGLNDLKIACSTSIEHLSWYQLTIEANTHFAKKTPILPSSEKIEDLYEHGLEYLQNNHFKQYEISAYTRNKPSAHNVNYWSGGDYIGIGAGSHSKWTYSSDIQRWSLWRLPKKYLNHLASERKEWSASIAEDDRMFEYFLNRSRMSGHLSWEELSYQSTVHIDYAKKWLHTRKHLINNFLEISNNGVTFKSDAMLFNRLFLEILLEQRTA